MRLHPNHGRTGSEVGRSSVIIMELAKRKAVILDSTNFWRGW